MYQNSSGSRKRTRPSNNEQQQKRLVTSRLIVLGPVGEVSHRNRTTHDAIQLSQATLQPISLVEAPPIQAMILCTVVQGLQDQWLPLMEMPRVDMPINSLLEDQ
jgi:hypothetical protein